MTKELYEQSEHKVSITIIKGLWFGIVAAVVMTVVSGCSIKYFNQGEELMDLKQMSRQELIQLALSAASPHIAKDAAVMIPDENGNLVEVRKGTNGFTCIPKADPSVPKPDPICMDQAVLQFFNSFQNNEPKPANTVPGVSYMAQGTQAWVKDETVLTKKEPGARLVDFPPHVMVMWPFDSRTSGIPPCRPTHDSVICITFDGSPYAMLIIYQDPSKMK